MLNRNLIKQFLDFAFPPHCLVCDRELGNSEAKQSTVKNTVLCSACDPYSGSVVNLGSSDSLTVVPIIPWCDACGEMTTLWDQNREICLPCTIWPMPCRRVRSLFRYSDNIENIIKALKYRGKHPLANFLGGLLAEAVRANVPRNLFPETSWDLVVPVPSAPGATRKRGFSHTALIARFLARNLRVRWEPLALGNARARAAQVTLSADERFKNVEGAFVAAPKRVQGKRILLVDDVITTGASMWAASTALIEAGADFVDVISLARSRQFSKQRLLSAQKEQLSRAHGY